MLSVWRRRLLMLLSAMTGNCANHPADEAVDLRIAARRQQQVTK
jgi:hypothetical protein